MPKLNLKNAKSIKSTYGDFIKLKGLDFQWSKPNSLSLSQFYGIGEGQIPIDLRIDDSTVDGANNIVFVRNDGGAGSAYDMAQRGTLGLPVSNGLYGEVNNNRGLKMANPFNWRGKHVVVVAQPVQQSTIQVNGHAVFGQDNSSETYFILDGYRIGFRTGGKYPASFVHNSGENTTNIYEWRAGAEGRLNLYIGGNLVDTSPSAITDNNFDTFGSGRTDRPGHGFNGNLGRAFVINTDPNYSPGNVEPAVIAARNTLANIYGITLSS